MPRTLKIPRSKRTSRNRRELLATTAKKTDWESTAKPQKRRPKSVHDVKVLRGALRPLHEDELRRIPVLANGSQLKAGASYIDLRRVDLREFTADGNEVVEDGELIVARADIDSALWNKLLRVEWKEGQRWNPLVKERPRRKTKSMTGSDGNRKLATGHGRAKRKTGGEPQKTRSAPQGSGRRSGSSKDHK